MPYDVRKSGDSYEVIVKHSGKVLGRHKSKKKAARQLAAVYANSGKEARGFATLETKVTLLGAAMGAVIPLGAMAADIHSYLPLVVSVLNAFGPPMLMLVMRWRRKAIEEREKLAAKLLADNDPKNDNEALNIQVQDAQEKAFLDVVESTLPKAQDK